MRPRTRIAYLSFAGLIGRHHQRDPESLSESQVRDYLLFLRTERSYAASSMGVAFAALRCYFCDCLKTGADWAVWEEFKVRRPDLLPVVMSRAEAARLIGATRCDRFRTAFTLIYHCGLRISEAMSLEVSHIRNGSLHIRDGKGGKDRLVPISPAMVEDLRRFWRRHRHPRWIFPGLTCAWKAHKQPLPELARAAKKHMSEAGVRNAFRMTLAASGITLEATPHTLRHSYATHLLEEGVSIRLISMYLGHSCLETTLIYTHLTAVSEESTREALSRLYQAVTLPRYSKLLAPKSGQ